MWIFSKKEEKLHTLSIKDLSYIYQYVVLKYNEVKFYKSLYFLLVKRRDDLFEFINVIDPEYLKKSSLLYITEDKQHNESVFDSESNYILNLDINKELVKYLKIKIDNGMVFKRIDTEYNKLFKSKWTIFFIFVLVLWAIIYIIWSQFKELEDDSMQVNLDSVFFFYDYNVIITGFVFFITFAIFFFNYIKHLPLIEYTFSKYYSLLKYKEFLYNMMLRYYIDKWPGKRPEIGYINLKDEFYNIFYNIYWYLDKDEFSDLLFFLENPKIDINVKNPFLKQDIINDYQNLMKVQNEDVREKLTFYEDIVEKNIVYNNLLKMNFEEELERLKEFLNLKWLVLYMVITIMVMWMILPVVLSAM